MRAVLAQVQDGKERAIYYAFKASQKSQMNYSATKLDFLDIVALTRHFKHYLLGRKIKIVTDQRELQLLYSFRDPDGLTTRWLETLAGFDYEVQHRSGKSIGHADGLSRIPFVNQLTTSASKKKLDEAVKQSSLNSIIKLVIFLNQKTHLHTAYCRTSNCPRE